MPARYTCPRCKGDGVLHRLDAEDEAACLRDCEACDATGFVSKKHRDELIAWRQKCRQRCREAPSMRPSPRPRIN